MANIAAEGWSRGVVNSAATQHVLASPCGHPKNAPGRDRNNKVQQGADLEDDSARPRLISKKARRAPTQPIHLKSIRGARGSFLLDEAASRHAITPRPHPQARPPDRLWHSALLLTLAGNATPRCGPGSSFGTEAHPIPTGVLSPARYRGPLVLRVRKSTKNVPDPAVNPLTEGMAHSPMNAATRRAQRSDGQKRQQKRLCAAAPGHDERSAATHNSGHNIGYVPRKPWRLTGPALAPLQRRW